MRYVVRKREKIGKKLQRHPLRWLERWADWDAPGGTCNCAGDAVRRNGRRLRVTLGKWDTFVKLAAITSACAPHSRRLGKTRDDFWEALREEMNKVLKHRVQVIGVDPSRRRGMTETTEDNWILYDQKKIMGKRIRIGAAEGGNGENSLKTIAVRGGAPVKK